VALKSLSKDALYAPLSSYLKTQQLTQNADTKPAASPGLDTSGLRVPFSLRGSALHDFLERVSVEFHCPNSAVVSGTGCYGGGSNGGQPLRKNRYESLIAQRSLTLIGGGVNGPVASAGATAIPGRDATNGGLKEAQLRQKRRRRPKGPRRSHGSISNKKRKTELSQIDMSGAHKNSLGEKKQTNKFPMQVGEVECKMHRNGASKNVVFAKSASASQLADGVQLTTTALLSLNEMWNEYIMSLIGPPLTIGKFNRHEISVRLSEAELVGAYAKIICCSSCPILKGFDGMVVGNTGNTWRIAAPMLDPAKKSTLNDHNVSIEQSLTSITRWKVWIVPKCGSSLSLRIKIGDTTSVQHITKGGSVVRGMLCITLEGSARKPK